MFGPSAILFAATYPERVSALFLVNTSSRLLLDDDYPIGVTRELLEFLMNAALHHWGTPDFVRLVTPDADADDIALVGHQQRQAVTPKTAERQLREICFGDIREALPAIQAPTVVIHRREPHEAILPFVMGEFLAQNIPDARLVPLEAGDHFLTADHDEVAYQAIEKVLTGELKARQPERTFATVIFEDIVGSTDRAAQLGDKRWKQLLNHHDNIAARVIEPEGQVVDTTGDGVVAVFESPSRALRCMQLMRDEMRSLDLEIRVGVHAGEVERRGTGIAGIAVHIAARVCALANPAELLVSRTVVDLVVGSNARFADRGEHGLKGVPGSWRLFSVVD
jgi:class 3 adenylate cyclase